MKIGIFAGLGNQLFQFAFGHAVLQPNNGLLEFVVDSNPPGYRPYELNNLMDRCSHYDSVTRSNFFDRNLIQKIDTKMQISHSLLSDFAVLFSSRKIAQQAFIYDYRKLHKSKINLGYFQNWRYVYDAWPIMESEIINQISSFEPKSSSEKEIDVVMHVRRGDLVKSKTSMGLLSKEYYLRCLEIIKSQDKKHRIVIVTDDLQESEDISRVVGASSILSSEDLSAWQTLNLMMNSKYVIAANSTFSWWGALLSLKRGGSVFVPDPWFQNWKEEVGDAFHFPGMQIVQSTFED